MNVPAVAPESPELGHGAEGTHAEVGHEAAGEHGGAFPPFDPTYFGSQILWLALTFGFFYWILSKKILPRMSGILETRQDRIGADLAEAERFRAETDAAIAAYEQALAEAKAKAGAIATETREKVTADLDSAARPPTRISAPSSPPRKPASPRSRRRPWPRWTPSPPTPPPPSWRR